MNGRCQLFLRLAFICALLLGASQHVPAQEAPSPLGRITYRLSMTRPVSHLFEVSIEIETENGFPAETLDFQMPRWTPGRYAVFDFAKNVQEFHASLACLPGKDCAAVAPLIARTDNQTWRVETRNALSITVAYKVFGNDLSGTFSQLDTRHANFNGGSIFMYVAGHKPDPLQLEIEPPGGWRIINGRMESLEQRVWEFPNYDVLIDTPTEIAPDWTLDEFKVDGKTYRVAVHSLGAEGGKRPALVRDIEKIVRAETAMWGAPEFDSYTFLLHFAADDRSSDGMEHLTSTQIIESSALADSGSYESMLDGVAHEFFHVWNVKRLRPVELGPWDFTQPLSTRSLWIAEGLTNYYGHLMLRRAGVTDDEQFRHTLAAYIGSIENVQGGRLMSAEDASLSASFQDGGAHVQRTNMANTSVSYYNKGETVGIVLDLLLRGRTKGRASLDDVMRRLYEEFYVRSPKATYYLKGRGYTGADFERVTTAVAGRDMSDFFRRYVRGAEVLPYDEAFGYLGLKLVREPAREPYTAGIQLDEETQQVVRIRSVRNDSAAEAAGLQADDVILSLGGKTVTQMSWAELLNQHKRGERVPVTVRRDRQTIQAIITLADPERYTYRIEERSDATPEMRALRAAWVKGM